jgi:hypothetical protein
LNKDISFSELNLKSVSFYFLQTNKKKQKKTMSTSAPAQEKGSTTYKCSKCGGQFKGNLSLHESKCGSPKPLGTPFIKLVEKK